MPEYGPHLVPSEWAFLTDEPGPKMLRIGLSQYGLREIPGPTHSPEIVRMARDVGGWVADFYDNDEIPWCGLYIGWVAMQAGKPVTQRMLSARSWLAWGRKVAGKPKLGDVLVFERGNKGGHVGLYVGESRDGKTYAVLGGNQGNQVNITHVEQRRLLGVRNHYEIGQPRNCRRVFYDRAPDGAVSTNEQ